MLLFIILLLLRIDQAQRVDFVGEEHDPINKRPFTSKPSGGMLKGKTSERFSVTSKKKKTCVVLGFDVKMSQGAGVILYRLTSMAVMRI